MKTTTRILLFVVTTAWASLVMAQPPHEEGLPFDGMAPRQPPPMPEEGAPPHGEPGFRPISPLHHWMQNLRENEPEEFRRLQELRINDPAEFRAATREKMQQHAMSRLQKERPSIHEALMGLSPEDREWLMERLLRPPMGRGPMPERGPMARGKDVSGPPDGNPEIDRGLIRAYAQAESNEQKSRIREQLRAQLSAAYDRQVEARREQLAEAEEKITAIRDAINEGERGKEDFIERKLSAWLDQPPGKKPRP